MSGLSIAKLMYRELLDKEPLSVALQHIPPSNFRPAYMPPSDTLNQPNGVTAMGDLDNDPYLGVPGPRSHAHEYVADKPVTQEPSEPTVTLPLSQYRNLQLHYCDRLRLARLLKDAADAHHIYEATLDGPDAHWPEW